MKIQIVSDIHLEMRNNYILQQTISDVIVLAGDISTGLRGIEFVENQSRLHEKPAVYVAGNHEYYGHDLPILLAEIRSFADKHQHVHFLENDEVIIEDVRFLGATLWTDYVGNGTQSQEANMAVLNASLTDHSVIRSGNRRFLPDDALAIHQTSRVWLTEKLAEQFDGRTVVVTHHAPSLKCQHQFYDYSAIATGFLSEIDDLVAKADVWIYGHTHSNLDTKIGKCHLVSNQVGYPHEDLPSSFRPDWVLEV
ncbi:MAG: serine/threonine protein phosphatase [Gammaproteobacteria bacterium]|nr:MAG: serine/threonine protein phosphatase [Gammaproteobacteria bacterium]